MPQLRRVRGYHNLRQQFRALRTSSSPTDPLSPLHHGPTARRPIPVELVSMGRVPVIPKPDFLFGLDMSKMKPRSFSGRMRRRIQPFVPTLAPVTEEAENIIQFPPHPPTSTTNEPRGGPANETSPSAVVGTAATPIQILSSPGSPSSSTASQGNSSAGPHASGPSRDGTLSTESLDQVQPLWPEMQSQRDRAWRWLNDDQITSDKQGVASNWNSDSTTLVASQGLSDEETNQNASLPHRQWESRDRNNIPFSQCYRHQRSFCIRCSNYESPPTTLRDNGSHRLSPPAEPSRPWAASLRVIGEPSGEPSSTATVPRQRHIFARIYDTLTNPYRRYRERREWDHSCKHGMMCTTRAPKNFRLHTSLLGPQ